MKKATHILDRDRTGICSEGECKNLVDPMLKKQQDQINAAHIQTDNDLIFQAEEDRQELINKANVETPDSYPDASWTKSRTEAPGSWGGHC